MGSSGGASYQASEVVSPAIAKDAQIAQQTSDAQRQERSLRRGIGSTYSRFNNGAMQPISNDSAAQNGVKKTLG